MNMKTGFNLVTEEDNEVQEMVASSTSMFLVLLEDAMESAGNYAKASGRNTVTATDMKYALRYHARNTHHIQNMSDRSKLAMSDFNECMDSQSDTSDSGESDDDLVVPEEEVEPFKRAPDTYSEHIAHINYFYDTWDEWIPETTAECLLKNTIDLRLT
jgi:hypothetical protein